MTQNPGNSTGRDETAGRGNANPWKLSEREQDVLRLISEGKTNKEIASVLQISIHTVDAHIRRIFSRLGVRNRVQAALAWHGYRHGS